MDQTQSFRLIGTTEIVRLPVQHLDGQNVVFWESIEQVFPGVRYVKKNSEVAVTAEKDSKGIRIIPFRIKHYPGAVLDVTLSTPVDHGNANLSVALVGVDLSDTTDDALNASQAVGALQVVVSPAVESISEAKPSFQQIVKLASKKAQVFEIEQRLISSLDPAIQKTVQASLRARNMSVQAHNEGRMEDYERHRNESNGLLQEMKEFMVKKADEADHRATLMLAKQDEQNATIEQLKIQNAKSMQELNATIVQLQIQNAKSMQELNAKQDEASADMKKMREELMGQFAVLQSRIQAVLTQTYELHEYPIPRLFVVLPQDPSRWHTVNPFSNKFRLYFLCECGEHTKLTNSQTKIPHHIHLAKHEGYEIARPSDFFQQYGSYVLTILKILKFGINVAGVAVPALPLLINTESVGQATASLQKLQEHIELGVDRTIGHIDNLLAHDGGVDEEAGEQVKNKEALEGADLRKLETFLKGNDGNKALGNLYRTVTDKGHVKWVCIDHYRENYSKKATEAFRRAVDLVAGSFNENIGRVVVVLQSREQAEQFYAALEQARSVHELKIKLSWETTYGDFKKLLDTLRNTSVGVLEFGYTGTGPASDYVNRNKRYDPIRQIMRLPSIQLFTMASIQDDFLKRSNFNSADTDFSNLKRLVIGGFDSGASIKRFKLQDKVSIELEMEMKPANGSRLLLEAPPDFFEEFSLWPTDAEFLNLKRLVIKGFDVDISVVRFYMAHAPALTALELTGSSIGDNEARALAELLKTNETLTTLNLACNSIGDNGAQALCEALKASSTLATLDLRDNKIGDNGAQVLADALKINETLTALDLTGNSIGDDGAQALSDALKTNETLINLDLKRNSIWFKGLPAFSEAIETNKTLTTLDLDSNAIGPDGAKALVEAL
ncbi:hypothetical protein BGX27_002939, partial [Mortierella sp. AM989]